MPSIQLNAANSLDIDASVADQDATLNKYLKNPISFFSQDFSLADAERTTVKQVDHARFPVNFSLKQGGKFQVVKVGFNLKPGFAAVLDLLTGSKAGDVAKLCAARDARAETAAAQFVSFALTGTLDGTPTETVDGFCFGMTAGEDLTIANYRPVTDDEVFAEAAKATVCGLAIPHDIEDLKRIPAGSVCGVKGSGSLQFTVSFQYSFLNNPLVSVPLPALPLSLAVKAQAGGSLDVSVKHTAGHDMKIAALGGGKVRLSANLTSGQDVETGLQLSIGTSATIMDQDALEFLLQKISDDPDKEIEKLKQDLPPGPEREQLCAGIKTAIQGAIDCNFKASLKETLERANETSWLLGYEIDLNALDQTSTEALQSALAGDFQLLTKSNGGLKGITPLDSALTLTAKSSHALTAHLIGIFNFNDVSSFVRTAKPALNKDTGEIVLTAEHIEIVENNLDADKLREVLVKSAMLTAAAAANTAGYPDFALKFVYFLHYPNASRPEVREAVNALGLVNSPQQRVAAQLLDTNDSHYGNMSLYLGLNLDSTANRTLFLNGTAARISDEYVRAACNAMEALLNDVPDSKNRLPLFTAGLPFWNELRSAGSRDNIVALLKQHNIQETAAADFYALDWWAGAMGHMADAIAQKKPLEKAGADVVEKSTGGFNEPWAVLASYLILQPRATVTSKFTCGKAVPQVTTAAAGAGAALPV